MVQHRYHGILALLVLAAGCAAPLSERAAHIKLTERAPGCDYETLGEVSAGDGYIPMEGQSAEWHSEANEDLVLAKLREQADALGGHTVIIQTNERVNLPDGRPARIEKRGVAISACR